MAQPHHDPLAPIDGNSQGDVAEQSNPFDPLSTANSKPVPAFSQESQQHKSLHSKLMRQQKTGQQQGQYVSPSDNILSPASQKLNSFKERRFTKQAKPRTLFGSTKSLSFDGPSENAAPDATTQAQSSGATTQEGDAKMNEG